MRVGIIQSNYIPWRGYFDFINSVDIFILYDCVQYTKRDWRNRNLIKCHTGTQWLSIPVITQERKQLINETAIDYSQEWMGKNLRSIFWNYKNTPYFDLYYEEYEDIINRRYELISELNEKLIKWAMQHLNVTTSIARAPYIDKKLGRTENLLSIVQQYNGTTYVSGPSAASYLNVNLFADAGVGLEYKVYEYDSYPQLYPPFAGNVTILDLLFNVGPEAKNCITSKAPNTVVFSPVSKPKRIHA